MPASSLLSLLGNLLTRPRTQQQRQHRKAEHSRLQEAALHLVTEHWQAPAAAGPAPDSQPEQQQQQQQQQQHSPALAAVAEATAAVVQAFSAQVGITGVTFKPSAAADDHQHCLQSCCYLWHCMKKACCLSFAQALTCLWILPSLSAADSGSPCGRPAAIPCYASAWTRCPWQRL